MDRGATLVGGQGARAGGAREHGEPGLGAGRAGQTPKLHYSTPKTAMEERRRKVGRGVETSWVLPQLRAHADMIDPIAFEHFVRETAAGLEFDVMLEAKGKDLALLRLREQLAERGIELEAPATAAPAAGPRGTPRGPR